MRFEILLFLAISTCIWSQQIPASSRERFSIEFFRRISRDHVKENFVISTAAAHKWLALFYDSCERLENSCDVDHYTRDLRFAFDLTNMLVHFSAWDVINYFRNDFREINEGLAVQSYIECPTEFKNDFKELAKAFLNVEIISKNVSAPILEEFKKFRAEHESEPFVERTEILEEGDYGRIKKKANMRIYSWIKLDTNFKNKFVLENGKLHGIGRLRYDRAFHFSGYQQIIELPLSTHPELTLEIFLPENEEAYINFIYNREYTTMSLESISEFDKNLNWKTVEVILPKFKFENITNIGTILATEAYGATKLFHDEPGKYPKIFEDKELQSKIEFFSQKSTINITPIVNGGVTTDEKPTETFDASNKSFTYFIKSKDVIYFVGQRFVPGS